MTHARDREYLGKLVEEKLNLAENAYSRKNSKHKAAELQNCYTFKNKNKRSAQPHRSKLLLLLAVVVEKGI